MFSIIEHWKKWKEISGWINIHASSSQITKQIWLSGLRKIFYIKWMLHPLKDFEVMAGLEVLCYIWIVIKLWWLEFLTQQGLVRLPLLELYKADSSNFQLTCFTEGKSEPLDWCVWYEVEFTSIASFYKLLSQKSTRICHLGVTRNSLHDKNCLSFLIMWMILNS